MNESFVQRQEKLFAQWKSSYSEEKQLLFIRDGIFCEEEWVKQSPKVLFVLKEADGSDAAEAGLCDYLLSEVSSGYWKTWNNIVRWTQALLNNDMDGSNYQHDVSKADKTFWLKKTAAINLKKICGGASANSDKIREFAEKDKKYLLKQIEIYDADIIICCGRGEGKNADILYDSVLKGEVGEWGQKVGRYNYFLYTPDGKNKQVPVVSFVHPQMYGGHERFKERYCDMLQIRKELCHCWQKR